MPNDSALMQDMIQRLTDKTLYCDMSGDIRNMLVGCLNLLSAAVDTETVPTLADILIHATLLFQNIALRELRYSAQYKEKV